MPCRFSLLICSSNFSTWLSVIRCLAGMFLDFLNLEKILDFKYPFETPYSCMLRKVEIWIFKEDTFNLFDCSDKKLWIRGSVLSLIVVLCWAKKIVYWAMFFSYVFLVLGLLYDCKNNSINSISEIVFITSCLTSGLVSQI